MKQQGDGVGEHLKNDKLRVAGHGLGTTLTRRTNTAKRAPNMLTHRSHVLVPVCAISILWNFHTNPYQSSETTRRNNKVPVKPSRTEITSYELHNTGWAPRAPVAQPLQSVRQTCLCTTATRPYRLVRFPLSGTFIPAPTCVQVQ